MTARHVTTAQLAAALGVPRSTVHRQATAEGWAFVEEPAQGGARRLYAVDELPAALRAKLTWGGAAPSADAEARAAAGAGRADAARQVLAAGLDARAAETRRAASLRLAAGLSAAAQARMDARLAVLRALESHAAASPKLPAAQVRATFAAAYNAGLVPLPPAARAEVATVSDTTLARWQRDLRQHGIAALAGAYGNRAGSGRIDSEPALREYVQAMLVQHPHARATHVMRGLQARFGSAGLPSARALERWIGAWREANAEVLVALTDPDAWKNRHMVAFGSASAGITAINALWELDSSPADVMCTDGRCTLLAGIDVATRSARLLVAPTSKAVAVAALLRRMLLELGVPDAAKTDNGSDYTSAHVVRVLAGLDVRHELCPPFQPWHKPHVERFFGTFARGLQELLPGYIGHSVAERQAIQARQSFADRLLKRGEVVEVRLSSAELQAVCDRWLESIYHVEPHEGLARRSPLEVAAGQQRQVRRIGDERALDVLLAEAPGGRGGLRTVQKKGIHLDSGWYIAPELEAWVGRTVQVRYDPVTHDLGSVFVFCAETAAFLCSAVHPERAGVDRRDVALKARTMQRQRVQAERAALRAAAKRVGVDDVVREVLRDRAAASGKLAVLRPVQAVHTSPGLAAAAQAAAQANPAPAPAAVEQLAAVQAARARLEAAEAPRPVTVVAPVFESLGARVQWLLHEQHRRPLGAEEAEALLAYRREQPASYRRMAALADEASAATKNNAPGLDGTGAL
jgi:transposase InsO family protein